MGASCWHEFAPYDPDPEVALQRQREAVFAAGHVSDHYQATRETVVRFWRAFGDDKVDGLSREERATVRSMRRFLGGIPPTLRAMMAARFTAEAGGSGRTPGSIDDLLEAVGEEGTHSILDIDHVAARREFGAAVALSPARVRHHFGTNQPTRAQVAAAWADVADGLGRWEAVYLVVYRDGQPDGYAFIGCSGD